MALTWATPEDVTGRWIGGEIPATTAQITRLLEDVEDTILSEFADMPTRIARAEGSDTTTGPSVPKARVAKIAARVVIRHLRNPEGQRSRMDVGGPFTQNVVFGGDEPGSLDLTDEDRAELGGTRTGGAFTIDSGPAGSAYEWLTPDTWRPIS